MPAATAPSAARKTAAPTRTALVAAAFCLAMRAAYFLYAAWLVPHLRFDPRLVRSNAFADHLMPLTDRWLYAALGAWERFDTLWYMHIAQSGYDRPAAIVFYPLYPALIRAFSLAVSPLAAALAVSTAALFFFLWGLGRLVELDYDRGTAARALWIAALWPASFMLAAGYADSLVAAFTVWSLYFARRDRWLGAAALGICAALAKAVGGLVAVPLIVLVWKQNRGRWWAALLPLLPLAAWQAATHPGEVYARYWNTGTQFPWTTLAACARRFVTGDADLLFKLNLAFLVLVCILVLPKGVRAEYRWYAAAVVALFLTKNTNPLLQSTMRYVVVVFPAYLGLALRVRRPMALVALAAILVPLNALLLWKFFDWSLVV
jgi:hypothetical protein